MSAPDESMFSFSWLIDPALEREALDFAGVRVGEWLARQGGVKDDACFMAVTLCLGAVCREGSLCLPATETSLAESLRSFFDTAGIKPPGDAYDPASLARQFLSGANAGRYCAILGSEQDIKPLILWRKNLYFQRHFHAERVIAEGLSLRLKPLPCDLEAARSVLREILEEKPLRSPQSRPFELTPRQKWALAAALREKIFLISGGPGTGKTALMASLLRALIRLRGLAPERIRLCAPTGRAAQRLQESLRTSMASLIPFPKEDGTHNEGPDAFLSQIPVETLHRMLGYHFPTGRFARNQDDPLPVDLVLLDEASMADAFILSALIQALPPEAALILVGDADQLPAVEAGSILNELLPASRQPSLDGETWKWVADCFPENVPDAASRLPLETVSTVILDRSHRARQSLLDFAAAINSGDAETVLQKPRIDAAKGDFSAALPDLLREYADSLFLNRRIRGLTYVEWLNRVDESSEEGEILSALMEFLASERILTCIRHGVLGCNHINAVLRGRLQPVFEKNSAENARTEAFHGAPLLITRNDARTGLSNGETGLWLRRGALFTACFPRNGTWLRLPMAFLPPWEPAFATTVHKSQGSECDAVLLVLPETGNRLLSREILYTAVTRARESVRIFGSEAALREALGNRVRRHSGLREYFKVN